MRRRLLSGRTAEQMRAIIERCAGIDVGKKGYLQKTDNTARLEDSLFPCSSTCMQRERARETSLRSHSKPFLFNTKILLAHSAIRFLKRPLLSRCTQFLEIRLFVFNPFPGFDCIVTALKSRIVAHKTRANFLLKFGWDISKKMTLTFLGASVSVLDLSTARQLG